MSETFKFEGVTYTAGNDGYYYAQVNGGRRGRISEATYRRTAARAGITPPESTPEEPAKLMAEIAPLQQITRKAQMGGVQVRVAGREFLLTKMQLDFLHGLLDTNCAAGARIQDIVDSLEGDFFESPMRVGAMISTLREKGLATIGYKQEDGRRVKTLRFTVEGNAVLKALEERRR